MAKANHESQLLNLLKSVLPKAVPDPALAEKIYSALEQEIVVKTRVASFDKFCKLCEMPSLEADSVSQVKEQFEASFGKGTVSIVPHPEKQSAAVEVVLPTGTLEGVIRVNGSPEKGAEDGEGKMKFVPFPVCLEGDPELIWLLSRHENLSPDEACVALSKAQEGFWESKAGQKHLRDRVERSFPEFMTKAPAKMLSEVGLRRHYKDPEPVKQFKMIKPRKNE